jgi:hypothetical protein
MATATEGDKKLGDTTAGVVIAVVVAAATSEPVETAAPVAGAALCRALEPRLRLWQADSVSASRSAGKTRIVVGIV